MNIKNSTYSEVRECNNCKNEDICKWVSTRNGVNLAVYEIWENQEFCSPIKINVICDNFEEKPQNKKLGL